MSDKIDELKQEVALLTQTYKEHVEADDMATIDQKQLEKDLVALVDKRVKEEMEEAEAKKPVRKGEWIGPEGFQARDPGIVEYGKYAGQKMSDVGWAYTFLKQANALDPRGCRPPSKDLEDIHQKLLTATGTATGDEYVPTGMAAELWSDWFLGSKIVGALGVVPMPTATHSNFHCHGGLSLGGRVELERPAMRKTQRRQTAP
jgi:hypothetical protein